LPKERRALEELLSESKDHIPIPAAMILKGHLLEEWLLDRRERDCPPGILGRKRRSGIRRATMRDA